MSVTTALGQALLGCDRCPASFTGSRDDAEAEGWDFCAESQMTTCGCCVAEQHRRCEREYGYMRRVVAAYNDARRDGDYTAAIQIAFAHGVRE